MSNTSENKPPKLVTFYCDKCGVTIGTVPSAAVMCRKGHPMHPLATPTR